MPSVTRSCKDGDHDLCLQSALGNPSPKKCSCGCHKQGRADPNYKPVAREARVTSRQRSWNKHWYYAAFPGPVEEYYDPSIIRPPLTPEELKHRR